jgi:2-polyprenyl-6-hydroxyphenyl methylase/3-demethylubiquinone-9 3-methyltransferase
MTLLVKGLFLYNLPMPVDNDLYHREAHTWWDDESFLSILRIAVNPVRLDYLNIVLPKLGIKPEGLRALDVGSGGGYLSEELARLGMTVSGVDPAHASVAAAQSHAHETGLEIDYRVAQAEILPFPDGSFDLVTCCDVLEHVQELDRTFSEIARVLKPGGIFLYDTINRTFMTWLGVIFVAQEFPLTRFFPPDTHDWSMFIKPDELADSSKKHGIVNREVRGMSCVVNPIHQFWLILMLKWGFLTYREYGIRTYQRLSYDTTMNYIGYGICKK